MTILPTSSNRADAPPLTDLRPEHPRILARAEDFDRVRRLIETDPLAKRWHEQLKRRAGKMLEEPVTVHLLRDGKRLLYESREVKDRVLTLGMLYRLDPDPRYLDRIWADMQAAAAFPDWNPDHFLDVGEMTFAFAIAYDWLYDAWTDEQRQVIRNAIVKHGLQPGVEAHRNGVWWTTTTNNWNQVCHGGLICGALAIADRQPELAQAVIQNALTNLPISMARYAPDGGYDEGPAYWTYGTTYNIFAIAALESALGSDFGLSKTEGFDKTGLFPLQMAGPTGYTFNFADAKNSIVHAPILFYLAKRYNLPACAAYALAHATGDPLELLWYDPAQAAAAHTTTLPLDAHFAEVGATAMRSAWNDPNALFIAIKAGENGRSHGQLDLGSFILEAHNVRWLIDLGHDDYNLPGYFGRPRFTYYRNRAEGHNTLLIGPRNNPGAEYDQQPRAHADTSLDTAPDHATAVVDLSDAYADTTRRVERRFTLSRPAAGRLAVEISDVIETNDPTDIWWFAHTRAAVELSDDHRTATLSQAGKHLAVTLVEPADARFEVMPAQPLPGSPNPPGQNPNNGASATNLAPFTHFTRIGELPVYGEPAPDQAIRKLTIRLPDQTRTRITVRFESPR